MFHPHFAWHISKIRSQRSMQTAPISHSFWLNLKDVSRHYILPRATHDPVMLFH